MSAKGRQLVLSPELPQRVRVEYSLALTGFPFQPVGEYPRRAVEGETLAVADGLPLLSPISGLVRHEEDTQCFDIRLEGGFAKWQAKEFPENDFDFFIQSIKEAGLVQLEWKGKALFDLFQKAKKESGWTIVVSLRSIHKSIHTLLKTSQAPHGSGFIDRLLKYLSTFAESNDVGFEVITPKFFAKKAESYPEVIANKFSKDLSFKESPDAKKILFLSAETLLTLSSFFSEGRPFTSRITQVKSTSKNGLYRLCNGIPISSLFSSPDLKGNVRINKWTRISINELGSYNIYNSGKLDLEKHDKFVDGPCIGCMRCESVCPTNAHPLGAITGDSIQEENCILCGLCSEVCPSSIDLFSRISSNIEARPVW